MPYFKNQFKNEINKCWKSIMTWELKFVESAIQFKKENKRLRKKKVTFF